MRIIITSFIFGLFLFALYGCEGDPGKPGMNFLSDDIRPPNVEIIYPVAGSPVYNESLFEAFVQYNGVIDRVEFLVNGHWDTTGVLKVNERPYYVVWDCSELSLGRYFIQAAAWDSRGRVAFSPLLTVVKDDPANQPVDDTIRFYNPFTDVVRIWSLPSASADIRGYGTRFLIKDDGILNQIGLRVHRSDNWVGGLISVQIRSAKDGLPDSLLHDTQIDGARLRIIPPNNTIWSRLRLNPGVNVPQEFFIITELIEAADKDTLAIATDDGLWRNWRGFVNRAGVWEEFTAGGLAFNPMIYVLVEYE